MTQDELNAAMQSARELETTIAGLRGSGTLDGRADYYARYVELSVGLLLDHLRARSVDSPLPSAVRS